MVKFLILTSGSVLGYRIKELSGLHKPRFLKDSCTLQIFRAPKMEIRPRLAEWLIAETWKIRTKHYFLARVDDNRASGNESAVMIDFLEEANAEKNRCP